MQVLGPAADEGGAALQMVTVAVVKMMEVNGDGNSGGNDDDSGSGDDEVQDCPDGLKLRNGECVNDESDDESPQSSDSNDEPPEGNIPDDGNPSDTPPPVDTPTPVGDGTNSNLEGAGESPETLSTSSEQETGNDFLTSPTDTDGDGVSADQDADDDNNGLSDNAEVDTVVDGIPNDRDPDDNGNAIDDEFEDIDGDGIATTLIRTTKMTAYPIMEILMLIMMVYLITEILMLRPTGFWIRTNQIQREMVQWMIRTLTTTTTAYPIMKILMLTTTVFQIVNSSPLPERQGLVPILMRRQRVITLPG